MASFSVGSVGHLLLDTVPTKLAIPAAAVLDIVNAEGWKHEPPVPFGCLMPVQFAQDQPQWIVRVLGKDPIHTLVCGKVRFEYWHTEALFHMPALDCPGFHAYSNVVLVDGRPSALVVDIDALFRAHRELGK